jgi:signal transduction histidine kinase
MDELDGSISEEHCEFLEAIHSSSRYMLSLVEDLLDVTTISRGKLTLDRRPKSPEQIIRNSVSLNRILAEKKNIQIKIICQGNGEVHLDETRFAQVLNNLISNAIKFSSEDTIVEVACRIEDNRYIIEVRDQGPGIPKTEQENLFELYQRTSVTSADGEKSTGLGLAIAKSIVEAHDAELTVDSDVGKGTVFTITLPLNASREVNDGKTEG